MPITATAASAGPQAPIRRTRTGRLRSTGAGLALGLGLTPALADVTPEDVWASWQGYYASMGYTLGAGSEERSGDSLQLSDITGTFAQDGNSFSFTLDHVELTREGGRVRIALPAKMSVLADTPASEGGDEAGTVALDLALSHEDMDLTASGTPEDITYDLAAESLAIDLTNVVVDDEPIDMTVNGTLSQPKARAELRSQAAIGYEFTATVPTVDLALDARDPAEQAGVKLTGRLTDLEGQGSSLLPPGAAQASQSGNLASALHTGMQSSSSYRFGSAALDLDVDEPSGKTTGHITSMEGSGDVTVSSDGMRYAQAAKDTAIKLESSALPVPLDLSLAETAFALTMPLTRTETPAPVAVNARLIDLTLNDAVWGLIDPMSKLPRDPATLILDLTGMARMAVDIFDPEVAETLDTQTEQPVELHALDLNQLDLKVAGAELTGEGGFTFDNSDLATFAGWPKPLGQVDLRLTGGNGLLDTLIEMGLVPQEQAMGLRMMAGLFANLVPDTDEMTSTLEVREDGGFYVNGQRLR